MPNKIKLFLIFIISLFAEKTGFSQCTANAGPDQVVCQGGNGVTLGGSPTATGGTAPYTYSWMPTNGLSCTNCSNPIANPTSTTTYSVTIYNADSSCTATDFVTVTYSPKPTASFTFTGNNQCAGLPVNFANTSPGIGNTYSWNFGDGTTSNQVNPIHSFTSYGISTDTFDVVLTVTNALGCVSNITTQEVVVNQAPDPAVFDYTSATAFVNCGNQSFDLLLENTSTTVSTNTNYQISWGDGSPNFSGASFPNSGITHTYSTLGYFSLTSSVTGSNGCVSSESFDVYNGGNPAVGIGNPGNTINLCTPYDLTFPITGTNNNAPGTIYIVSSNTGQPNQTYNHPPPTSYVHTFVESSCGATGANNPNSYYIRVRAENPCGFSESTVEPITISKKPEADFTISPSTRICTNTTATFQNTSQNGIEVGSNLQCNTITRSNWTISPASGWTVVSGSLGNPTPTNNPNTWGSTILNVNYNQPGTYSISVITRNVCGNDTVTKTICVENPPTPNFLLSQDTACVGFITTTTNTSDLSNTCQVTRNWTVLFNGSSCTPSSGTWSFANGTNANSLEPAFQFNAPGSYTIRLALTNSCGTFYANRNVLVQGPPQVSLNSLSAICEGSTTTPSAITNNCYEPIDTYSWTFTGGSPATSSAASPGSITFANDGTFTVALQVSNQCGSANAQTSLLVKPIPSNVNPSAPSSICAGQNIPFSVTHSAGNTYQWSGPNGFSSSSTNPTITNSTTSNSGTYSVIVSNNGCSAVAQTVQVTVNPSPTVDAGTNQSICQNGTPISLTGTPAGGTWSGNGVTGNTFNPSSLSPGNTQVTYNFTSPTTGCSNTDNVTITVLAPPNVQAGADESVCNQPVAVTLTGSPAGGTWSGSGITNPSGQFTPSGTGNFTVSYSYTHPNGCSNTDNKIITVINPTSAIAGNDTTICANAPNVQLTGQPVGGTWSGIGVSSTGIFDPSITGTFPLVYSFGNGTCLTRDTLLAVVQSIPTVNAGSDFSLCQNADPITLSASPSGGTWSGSGVSGTNFNPNSLTPGNYTLNYEVTSGTTGCLNSDQVQVTVFQVPNAQAGSDLFLCNQPIPETLSGTPVGGSWTGTGITNSNGTFLPSVDGVFEIVYTVTSPQGCIDRDTINITVGAATLAEAGNDSSVCIDGANVQFSGLPIGGTWSGPGMNPSGLFDPTIAGTFELIYTVGAGTCLSKDTLEMVVHPLPVLQAGPAISICLNAENEQLTATPAGGSWSGTAVSSSGVFNPTLAGVGTHILTYSYQDPITLCDNSTTKTIQVLPIPNVSAGNDMTLCNQPIAATIVGSPIGGTWSGTGITNSSGQFTPSQVGVFEVVYTFTGSNSCTNTDTLSIEVVNPTQANAGNDFGICIDASSINLTGTPNNGTWSGSQVSPQGIFDPQTVGTVTLTYSFGTGTCLTTDLVEVTVHPLPTVDAGTDNEICFDAPAITLTGTPPGGAWSGTGVSGNSFTPSSAGVGTHTITYTYTNPTTGCTNTDNRNILVNPLPNPSAGNDTILCNQPVPVAFIGSPTGGTWSGSNITSSGIFTPNGIGSFTVNYTFSLGTGCQATDSKVITIVDAAQALAGPDLEACIGDNPIILNGQPLNGIWSGTNITPSGVFDPIQDGTFELVYSVGAGTCLTRDTLEMIVHPLPVVQAGNDADFCVSEPSFNFTGLPSNGIWSGTGITQPTNGTFNPAIATVGNHEIVYTYTHPITGCVNRDTLESIVHPLPVVNFTTPSVACIGTATSFTNTSTLGQSFTWNLGDGTTSVLESPNHTYSQTGFFDIQLIVTTAFGCQDSIEQTIELREPPFTSFSLTPDSSCAPVLVNFTNQSTGIGLSYAWNFGNGQTSTQQNPGNQTYNQGVLADTSYQITLAVTNFCGTTQATQTVIAMPSPTAIFGTNLDIGCSPFTVEFANNSLGLPDQVTWNFGDGTTSNDPNALLNHTFTTGLEDTTYTIQLIVENECGSDTAYHTITVLPNQVNAFFNTNITSGCIPLTVNFTQFSTGANVSSWDFGDGNTSVAYSPTHTFTQAGTYEVQLFVNDGCSFDTATVQIQVAPSPSVDFVFAPDSVCINETFVFTNLSQNLAGVSWDFGDGNSSTLTNPSHAYPQSGTYAVTMTGTSTTNGCTATITKPVLVSVNPEPDFVATPISGCIPLTVSFNQTGANVTYQSWDFGDGNSSIANDPSHTYTQAGTFAVELLVENANGCRDSLTQIITAHPLPDALFTYNSTDPCFAPVTLNTNNQSTGATNYQWNFGNGTTSTLTNQTTTYTIPGTYTISLTASNLYGCTDTYTQTFTVYPTPQASFVVSDDTICVGESVTFTSTSTFADSLVWQLGDGTTVNGTSINHTYGFAGNYPIQLTIFGAGGCSDVVILNPGVEVHPSPIAGFDYVNIQNPDPLSGTVEFTNTSINANSYQWYFGNGSFSTEENPIERYRQYGEFEATLIASNEFGCVDSITQIVQVAFFSGLFVPNAVYPGHPSFEVSHFLPKGVGLKTYEILIYDDWGNLIWTSTALDADGRPTEAWDATFNGAPVQQDAYVWKVNATFLDTRAWEGKEYEQGVYKKSGTVTVIR